MRLLIFALVWLPLLAGPAAAAEKLAVLDLTAKYGVNEGLAAALSVLLRDEIQSRSQYEVMSRDDLMAIAERQSLQQKSGDCDDSQCLIAFGRALGTRYMVAGDISKLGETYTISARLLDTEGAEAGVKKRVNERCKCSEEGLFATIEEVAAKILPGNNGPGGGNKKEGGPAAEAQAAAERAAAEQAAQERVVAAEQAAAEKIAAAERAAAEKIAAFERAAAERAEADKAAAEKAAAEKLAVFEKDAAERIASARAAAAEKILAEKIAAEKAALAEQAAAEKIAAAERAAAEKIAAVEKNAAARIAEEKAKAGRGWSNGSKLPADWELVDPLNGVAWKFYRAEKFRQEAEKLCTLSSDAKGWRVPSREDFKGLAVNPDLKIPPGLPTRYYTAETWDETMRAIPIHKLVKGMHYISYFDLAKKKPGIARSREGKFAVACVGPVQEAEGVQLPDGTAGDQAAGDLVVDDEGTGLTWEFHPSVIIDRFQAENFCASGWRLPSRQETTTFFSGVGKGKETGVPAEFFTAETWSGGGEPKTIGWIDSQTGSFKYNGASASIYVLKNGSFRQSHPESKSAVVCVKSR